MSLLSCPVCDEVLVKFEKSYQCKNGHNFDLSKEGYCNLLLNSKASSGDSKAMMHSRREFLGNGYYKKISDTLNEIIYHFVLDCGIKKASIADIGSGEGYYLENLKKEFSSQTDFSADYYGIDISKSGIKMAAKRDKEINWIVSNFVKLPFIDKEISVILSMFSNYDLEEFDRVLSPEGAIIIVRPTENHLIELKDIIYPEVMHKGKHKTKHLGFLENSVQLEYKATVSGQNNLQNLLKMTPHFWRIKKEGIENLSLLESLQVTVSVEIDVLTRTNHEKTVME